VFVKLALKHMGIKIIWEQLFVKH